MMCGSKVALKNNFVYVTVFAYLCFVFSALLSGLKQAGNRRKIVM